MTHQRIGLSLAVAVAAALAPTAPRAVELNAGAWKLTVSGNVNADYIHSSCESTPVEVDNGLACVSSNGNNTASSVSNGLLPAALVISASTTQSGYDISANFGMYPGVSTNDGGDPNHAIGGSTNTGLGTAGLDIRQVYLTFGNKDMGTFTFGRNIGLFQQDVILNDMTLPGVGGPGGAATGAPGNTTLGSIGLGYIYTDWLSQIDYTTPDLSGTKITIGIFDPLNPLGAPAEPKSAPGFHGKISYTVGGLYLSASGLYQKQASTPSDPTLFVPASSSYNSHAFDVGGKYTAGPFEILGWYYKASGVGTTALFLAGADPLGNPRNSDGFLAQMTYTVGPTKFGVNYGESKLDLSGSEVDPTLVAKNSKYTLGVYHKLTDNLTILGEYTNVTAKAQNDNENKANTFNIGAFLSF